MNDYVKTLYTLVLKNGYSFDTLVSAYTPDTGTTGVSIRDKFFKRLFSKKK